MKLSLLTYCLVLLFAGKALAVNDTVTCANPGVVSVSPCLPDECCAVFTFTVNQPTDQLDMDLVSTVTTPSDCIDNACWVGQSTSTITFTKVATGRYRINFSPALTPVQSASFKLCAPMACWNNNWVDFNYQAWYQGADVGHKNSNHIYTCSTDGECTGCDALTVTDNDCYVTLCIRHTGAPTNSFTIYATPAFSTYNLGLTGGTACNVPTSMVLPTGWTYSYVQNAGRGELTFNCAPGNEVGSCHTFCVDMPKGAVGNTASRTIWLAAPNPCSNNSFTITMKPSGANVSPTAVIEPAFPNPIDARAVFKTTIPFATRSAGHAYLLITDIGGRTVLTDEMDVLIAGRHSFYESARALPSGTYQYQIEAPKGVLCATGTIEVEK